MAKEKVYKLNTAVAEEPAEQEPVKSGRRHMGVWIAVLLILVIGIAGGIFWYIYTKRTYDDYEVLSQTASTDATQMSYVAYNGSLIKYSKEGISYLDKEGNALWMESYKMKQPMVVVSGEYVAAADMNGNAVYIFNKDGKVSSLETPYTICNLDVASQGVVAVVLENETENYIHRPEDALQQFQRLFVGLKDHGEVGLGARACRHPAIEGDEQAAYHGDVQRLDL